MMNTITVMNSTNTSRLSGNMRPMVKKIRVHEKPKWRLTERCLMQWVTKGNKRKNSREKSIRANTYKCVGSRDAINTDATMEAFMETFADSVVSFPLGGFLPLVSLERDAAMGEGGDVENV